MFLGYLNNDEANARAFDEEGYFRSGDVLRRVGNEYVYEGRISTDCACGSLLPITRKPNFH